MKNRIFLILLGSGWLFLGLFLISGYYFKKFNNIDSALLAPIPWEGHQQLFDGLVQCSLVGAELMERKESLRKNIFSKTKGKKEVPNGFIYQFDDDPELLAHALEFIQKEKACCPFFKFDVSILPFGKGFAIQISGSEMAKDMLVDFGAGG